MRSALRRVTALTGVAMLAALPGLASADGPATATVVTESDVLRQAESALPENKWVLHTRAGTPDSSGAFVDAPGTPPLGTGSLQLSTPDNAHKVFLFNYDHVGTALSDVDDISYSTYRLSGSAQQVTALNIVIDFNGPDEEGGFSTLVFEPVYNPAQGAVLGDTWQDWTASGSGRWWSTRAINDQLAGATTANMRTWDQIRASNPDATILGGVGVNQGGGNAGLKTNVDAFTFGDTTYDFERIRDLDGDGIADTAPPVTRDQCKGSEFASFNNPSFRNQGQCVSYVATRQ